MDLSDRTAIVTGASAGVGAATATELGEAGCDVALAARREDRLDAVAADIDAAETLVVPTDVTDEDAVDAMVETVVDTFGGVDLLVNNAGLLRGDPVVDAARDDLRDQIEVNLLGAMTVTHAVLPALLADDETGDVVTVSSMNARHPAAGGSAYTASKAGVNGFCDALRKELSDEAVRVTIVMPGPIETEMNSWDDWAGRALDPVDVAETIAFAVSRPPHVELPEVTVNTTDKLS